MAEIEYEVTDQVATPTINRPEKRGAMTYRVLAQFREGIGYASADEHRPAHFPGH